MGRDHVDAVVVGAGFAGLLLHHRLRGLGLTIQGFDAAEDVGGTWWWNRYPGARCDIESLDYSYSFSEELEQEWEWQERYAAQPEILAYANHVADRFDLRRDIRFGTRVTAATWDEAELRWAVETDRGDQVTATYLLMAVGCLSAAKDPEVEGIGSFRGLTYHTGRWPHEGVDLTGQRVGVIGTGSSGVQSIPLIARQAAHLTVFQRTPNFVLPAHNRPLDPDEVADLKRRYREHRAAQRASHGGVLIERAEVGAQAVADDERERILWDAWREGALFSLLSSFDDVLVDERSNELVAEFVRARIREAVHDPEVAERLSPRTYPFGTKRACLDTGYYQTFNRPNVTLVDLRETPIERITPAGVRCTDREHELDALVFATGFDAMTGAFLAPLITGAGGQTLRDRWAAGPLTYLGLATAGFPNLFLVTGPGSPSVLTNMLVSIEQHVEWITECIAHLRAEGMRTIEADPDAERDWVEHGREIADLTLFPKAASWYMGANVPGKPRVFMPYLGGVAGYGEVLRSVVADGYRGFRLA